MLRLHRNAVVAAMLALVACLFLYASAGDRSR